MAKQLYKNPGIKKAPSLSQFGGLYLNLITIGAETPICVANLSQQIQKIHKYRRIA